MGIRRLPRGIFFQFCSQVLTMFLQRISSLCKFPTNSEELRQFHSFPEFSYRLFSAKKNACSRIPAITTYPSVPICLQLVASRAVESTGIDIRLYGSYFATRVVGQLFLNILTIFFIRADVLLHSQIAIAHHRLRVHPAA